MSKILICDNEKDICDLVQAYMTKNGYESSVAIGGRQCLKKWEEEKPDLILLDIMMPDLSGWDVFKRIKAKDPEQKIIFMSVLEVSEKRKQELKREGLTDYVMKPFTEEALMKSVKNAL